MADTQYELRYLPLFYEDLEQKVIYNVKNFIIYYVVIDDVGSKKIMEVRRFLYNKQDREQLIWIN